MSNYLNYIIMVQQNVSTEKAVKKGQTGFYPKLLVRQILSGRVPLYGG